VGRRIAGKTRPIPARLLRIVRRSDHDADARWPDRLAVHIGGAGARVRDPIADLIIILFGVMLLFNINPFKKLPQVRVPLLSHPFANAFVYGLLYGPIALPCSGPLVVSIFALSLTVADALSKLNVFFWFGMGFGIPLLALSFLSGVAQRWITPPVRCAGAPDQPAQRVVVTGCGNLRPDCQLAVDQRLSVLRNPIPPGDIKSAQEILLR